jgi:hypothetical protein
MSRTASSPLLVVLTLALAACPAARGQEFPTDDDPLDKARARGMRGAPQAEAAPLKRALRDAALSGYAERMDRIRKGYDTPDVVLSLLPKLLAVDLALADGPAARLAARQRYWVGLREVEELTRDRVEAGVRQFTQADVWTARSERLLAELSLVHELGGAGKPLPGSRLTAFDDPDPLAARAVARDELVATHATERGLAAAARDACANDSAVRVQRLRAGSGTPDSVLAILPRRLAAERVLGRSPADFLAALEDLWQMAWECERLTRDRVEAGVRQFTQADVFDARAARLQMGVLIVEARRQPGKLVPPQGSLRERSPGEDDPLEGRGATRIRFTEMRSDVPQLLAERRETLVAGYTVRMQRMRAGSDSPILASEVSLRLLDAERDLAGRNKAERIAALGRYRARAAEIEGLLKGRVEGGIKQFTWADVYEAQFDRIQAELWIVEARAPKE